MSNIPIALGYVGVLLIVAVAFCWFNDRFTKTLWRWRNPPEKLTADRRALEQRLLHPDWRFFERHLQRPVPAALRELFADRTLLLNQACKYDEARHIAFEPIDVAALVEGVEWVGCDFVPFARSEGDSIYIRPGPSESDAVYLTYHDGAGADDTEQLAPDAATFVQRIRNGNPRT